MSQYLISSLVEVVYLLVNDFYLLLLFYELSVLYSGLVIWNRRTHHIDCAVRDRNRAFFHFLVSTVERWLSACRHGLLHILGHFFYAETDTEGLLLAWNNGVVHSTARHNLTCQWQVCVNVKHWVPLPVSDSMLLVLWSGNKYSLPLGRLRAESFASVVVLVGSHNVSRRGRVLEVFGVQNFLFLIRWDRLRAWMLYSCTHLHAGQEAVSIRHKDACPGIRSFDPVNVLHPFEFTMVAFTLASGIL